MKAKSISILFLFILCHQYTFSVYSPALAGSSSQLFFLETQDKDLDSYIEYPDELKPQLSINSTISEDMDFESALDPAEEVVLSVTSKKNIFKSAIRSKEIKRNFGEFIVGIVSAWLHSVSFLREVIHSPDFDKGECSLNLLWTNYQGIVQAKNEELTELIHKAIPGDISFEEKKKKCEKAISGEVTKVKADIEKRDSVIDNLKEEVKALKGKPDAIEAIKKEINIHQLAIKDYKKEQNQLKRISCKKTIEDPNMTIKYGVMTMSAYLKDFLAQCMKCFSKSVTGKATKVISGASIDLLNFSFGNPLEAIAHGITFGVYGIVKSMFHVIRLTLTVFKFFKAYKSSKWDEFAYEVGRSLGLSARVVLAILYGNRR